jgi:FkbM family methyltransferase
MNGKNISNPILNLASFVARVLPQPLINSIYRINPVARILRLILNRFSPEGLVPVSVAGGKLTGKNMVLDMHLEKDYWLGTYEPALMSVIADMVKPGMIAYDIGANIGYITLMLAQAVGVNGHVYAFEALDMNVKRLEKNLKINEIERQVTVILAAVAAHSGEARFHVGPSIGMGKLEGSVGRKAITYRDSVIVKSITLDDFIYLEGNRKPDIIKFDIEGGEVLAIQGMERILEELRPILLIELHGLEAAKEIWEKLMMFDYRFYKMESGKPIIKSLEELAWKSYVIAMPIERS